MQHRRTTVTLTALLAASSLLLAGCGSGDDGKDDKISGAQNSKDDKKSPGPAKDKSEDQAGDFTTSDIKLPKDLKLTFDWEKPSDPDKAAALDGAADYMRALMHGTVKQNPKDPVLTEHTVPMQSAQQYGTSTIKMDVEDKYTVTGAERYYDETVGDTVQGKLAEVTFCSNQSKLFSKEIESGKVLRTKPSDEDYLHFSIVMQKPSKAGSPWRARSFELQEEAAKQCKH